MPNVTTSLVDILREFIDAYELLQRLADRYRANQLLFSELQEFVGDDDGSALFRLKEKCHAVFRSQTGAGQGARPREALFDLAIGSLFHEAMKFREDFYQREVYGPRVRALRAESGSEADRLFSEFERILSAVSERLEKGLVETQSLMAQSWEQLRLLLSEHGDRGFLTRYLIERKTAFEKLEAPGLDTLLTELHGDPANGYAIAGRSYLASGHYEAADAALTQAAAKGGDLAEIRQLTAYAQGMSAYLAADYDECIKKLERWAAEGCAGEAALKAVASAAIASLDQLVVGDRRDTTLAASRKLAERILTAQ